MLKVVPYLVQRSFTVKCILFLSCVGLFSLISLYEPAHLVQLVSSVAAPPEDEDFSGLEADDARLIEYIRQHVIVPPSTEPYNLYYGVNHDPSDGQSKVVDELLNHKRNGFYVESGGYTGEVVSNTLFFEIQRNWTGILIEPNPRNFKKLLSRNRKVHSANACIGETKAAAKPRRREFRVQSPAVHPLGQARYQDFIRGVPPHPRREACSDRPHEV
ncbi:uncharacterized protein LOC108667636 [Hyalella azteca]|uniref:Uncharacterized protein LOC108667636 n=1 Tax=Hyalella azteca TaxID=294128 RepID=A0A8B7N9T2_HYAAZ|nr:uncharacterized protein LOC108667636 [Hyalella azteca]